MNEEEESVSVNLKQTPEGRKNIEIRGKEKRNSEVTGSEESGVMRRTEKKKVMMLVEGREQLEDKEKGDNAELTLRDMCE